jgi:cytochrome P450
MAHASRFCTPFVLQDIVQQRRGEGCSGRTDTLSELIRNSATSKSGGLTDSEICDQCITVILSAFETTTGLAGVALYMVTKYPEVK